MVHEWRTWNGRVARATLPRMGMFDYLKCDPPLPARREAEGMTFQTKDFDCVMETIHIHADGTVWGEEYDIEDRSDPNATGIARLAGMLTRTNIRPKPLLDFSGEITFYGDYGPRKQNGWGEGWLEFRATIEKGRMTSVELLEDKVPGVVAAAERKEALEETLGKERVGEDTPPERKRM